MGLAICILLYSAGLGPVLYSEDIINVTYVNNGFLYAITPNLPVTAGSVYTISVNDACAGYTGCQHYWLINQSNSYSGGNFYCGSTTPSGSSAAFETHVMPSGPSMLEWIGLNP